MPKNQQQEYGEIKLLNKHIIRTINGQHIFEIPADQIKVIGEFTTADGPFLDDWFITFITKHEWYEVPMDANGMDELLLELGNELNCKLDYQLTNSTDWKTRIIYPKILRDKELYKVVNKKPKTFLMWLLRIKETSREFSDEVRKVLDA